MSLNTPQRTMGTLPVFMTAISTILGAILFLRFGYAIAHVGLLSTLLVILIGHLVTIPTAMAVAEIATNQKVEGGGAYYMISRSFGLNIGGAIGIALYFSQAISVAFYVIAFTVSCRGLIDYANAELGWAVEPWMVNYGFMALLTLLMLTKGANVGVKALYFVVAILVVSLGMFFMGTGPGNGGSHDWYATIAESFTDPESGKLITRFSFFEVFTFIFPAFTGIAAGLGLSGDLKDPKKSIPRGTLWATVVGIVVYIAVSFKLFYSAPLESLASDELFMENIAIWSPIIPIGLACAAMSSALGSVLIAPRTLQALGVDCIFPSRFSGFIAKGKEGTNEPVAASLITCIIGFIFVSMGDINAVAEIISMFFMLTYGAICMVSFFEHMAADPSYRPTFRSKWYISLAGGLLCFYLMFKMNALYAWVSLILMVAIYIWVTYRNKEKKGIANLFKGIIFQVTRGLQMQLQKRDSFTDDEENWRPFVLSISKSTFERRAGFDMVRWIAHRYGFGTYVHFIEGFLNEDTRKQSQEVKGKLVRLAEGVKSRVYLDTIISPSFTSAIAQSIQLPGVSGKGNNMIVFEYTDQHKENIRQALDNYEILKSTNLDICLLRSTLRGFGYEKNIHLWITTSDAENAHMIILMGYILFGHPDWSEGKLTVYTIYHDHDREEKQDRLTKLIKEGRIPISQQNIELVRLDREADHREAVNLHSHEADLTVIGFNDSDIEKHGESTFEGYDKVGNVLFVNAQKNINLE
ncbi:amino acid permease [Sanyastnella coralliicola]|uniref:amino acid permease n=1 Tax=Sanyastnella coralliicola TaxID=3069118 RepID=UPI0027B899D5|nr:amino acid permease [Longitalea sp. SCSIO 12813]